MKYYHEIYKFTDGNEKIRNYNETNMPPLNQPIWGFAYDINDDTKKNRLICKPVLGQLLGDGYYYNTDFVPYKKNSQEFKKSGWVTINSRWYADTYEEAVEMYNELVQKRIDKLQKMIEEAKGDLI